MKNKRFWFTVDDNIRFLKEITEGGLQSMFAHPYLEMYKRLHEKYGVKIQLNLFFESKQFELTQMTDRYREEWKRNADWLKLSFHCRKEIARPYQASSYEEVFQDCSEVHREIKRFASPENLGKTTTIHYCVATEDGIRALKDCGVKGLLGLYGDSENSRNSYQTDAKENEHLRRGEIIVSDEMAYAGIDIVLNLYSPEEIRAKLDALIGREFVKVMIHEQYFYSDYPAYQPEFEQKLEDTFILLKENGYESIFFEECISVD